MKNLCDPHYPQYHLAPRQGWMNDPHPIYFKGAYHMFFQYSILPDDPYGGPHRWGHIMSRDLVHWEYLPPAITPKDHGIAEDRHIWSGCLVDNNGVGTAIYTIENIDIWTSTSTDDELRVFEKYGANPIIKGPPPEPGIMGEMRDPWVWKEKDGWYLTVGSGLKDGRGSMLPLYRSADLAHWQYLHPLYQGDPAKEDSTFCECPFFFPLRDKYVLALSAGATWMTGTFKEQRFQAEKRGRLDYGRFYVPQTLLDGKGRRILWGWVTERRDGEAQKRTGWAGMQTLPRVMSLGDDGALRFDPAPELATLRAEHHRDENLTVGETPILIKNSRGMQTELKVVFGPRSARRCGLVLRDKTELMRITYDAGTKTLQCADQSIPLALRPSENLTLRVFLDRSVVMANRQKELPGACRRAAKELALSPESPKAARLRELLQRVEAAGLADAAYAKMLARTGKKLLKDPAWPLVVGKFKASQLQAPVADIGAARPPRPGLAWRVAPFLSEYELADIRGVHGGADGVVYIEATVELERAYRGALAYGADGPVKVWVNGRVVDHRPQATNPARIGKYEVPGSWKKGVNRIVFALASNHGNAWGVQARVMRIQSL